MKSKFLFIALLSFLILSCGRDSVVGEKNLQSEIQTVAYKGNPQTQSTGYLVYTALMLQLDDDAPTAIVLENTIGNIVWSRNEVGDYSGTLSNAFPANKTFILITSATGNSKFVNGARTSSNTVGCFAFESSLGNATDDNEWQILIEVYP